LELLSTILFTQPSADARYNSYMYHLEGGLNYQDRVYSEVHNPQAGSGLRMCYIRPLEQVKKYKELVLNDGDFMNEFKFN